jgi:hypothetical protein
MTDVSLRPRKSAGVPGGGEFTAYAHQDPTVSLGRHAAPTSNRAVPESLRMAHFQDPDLEYNLEWAVEGSFRPGAPVDYHAENFSDHLRNLHYEESANYYSKACQAYADGGDWKAVIAEAAAADTALHPGGKLAEDYTPPVAEHLPGYMDGTLEIGSKYDGFRDGAAIAKDIRKDLAEAQKANYLPASVAFSVKTDKFSGGQAIRVVVQNVADADRTMGSTDLDRHGDLDTLPEFKELGKRVEAITDAYNRQDTNMGRDYSNVSYYSSVDIETDRGRQFRETEAAQRRQLREARIDYLNDKTTARAARK